MDSLVDQRDYGDSLHEYIATKDLLLSENHLTFVSQILDNGDEWDSLFIRLLNLNHDLDSVSTLDIPDSRGWRPHPRISFVNDDGAIDIFASYISGGPRRIAEFGIYRIAADRDTFTLRDYYYDEDFGDGKFTFVTTNKLRNGDYLLSGIYSTERFYGENDVREPGKAACLARMSSAGELMWLDARLDSVRFGAWPRHVFNWQGIMYCAFEHSSGCIYATGTTDRFSEPDWGIALYKYQPDGTLLWSRYYNDNYAQNNNTNYKHIIELRPDIMAFFGKLEYRPGAGGEVGLHVALFDTTGEILADTFIHGDWINDQSDVYSDILQIEPRRFLILTSQHNRICSIRFDLDDEQDFVVGGGNGIPPTAFLLNPAYPNPFNSSTTIEYRVGSNSNSTIRLSLYDLSGRLVQTLVEGRLTPGNYRTTVNANNLAAGVYHILLKTNTTSKVQKIVIVK